MAAWATKWEKNMIIIQLIERDGCTCRYCGVHLSRSKKGKEVNKLTIDHWIPRGSGGNNSLGNLVLACITCNGQKGNLLPQEFMKILEERRK